MNIPHIYEQVGMDRRQIQCNGHDVFLFLPIGDCGEITTDEQMALDWANQK